MTNIEGDIPTRDVRPSQQRFDKFTATARDSLSKAQEEAKMLGADYVGSEHLLLGMMSQRDSIARYFMQDEGYDYLRVLGRVREIAGTIEGPKEIGLTADAKKAIELAVQESRGEGGGYLGTAHILIGMVRGENIASQVIREAIPDDDSGSTIDRLRARLEHFTHKAETSK